MQIATIALMKATIPQSSSESRRLLQAGVERSPSTFEAAGDESDGW